MDREVQMQTIQFQRKRKFLVVLPILVFPFVTLMLWALGIVGSPKTTAKQVVQKGFNMDLPDASPPKDSNWNKLQFYQEADKDSARYRTMMRNDPYFHLSHKKEASLPDSNIQLTESIVGNGFKPKYDPYPTLPVNGKDPNEEKVYKKLEELNSELNKINTSGQDEKENTVGLKSSSSPVNTDDIDRLESMMQQMQSSESDDPQLSQLNGMLEKILDIQHPDRVKDKIKSRSELNKSQVFPVTVNNDPVQVSLLENKRYTERDVLSDTLRTSNYQIEKNAFYSLTEDGLANEVQTDIRATIPETQTLVSGATVKLRLSDDIYIGGILISKGEFVFGTASLNGERLLIAISSIQYKNSIFPVALSVYDIDGMQGIYMPGAITRDVAKQSTDQAIQSLSIATLDPSLGAQAASAGIQAAKSLIGKKVKLVKVTVRSGYEVLLRDDNKRQ
ncbi:MAG TPA: conjugative transposon protein TraM [Agriterribacter sp.]|nr:conjugative transposon protein TraM [Agriterribacter sp.]